MKIANMHDAEKLNEAQQRRLYASCQYIDGLLCQLEQAFHQEDSLSPFPRYVNDLNPAQMNKLKDQIRRIREQLLETLAWQGMKPESPSIPTSRVALTSLTFIDMTIEELSPRHLRGCGAVPEGAIDGLNRVVRDLRFAAGAMESYLRKKIASREEELTEG
jgi:hypothetical protein